MTAKEFSINYWQQYILLEKEFAQTQHYVSVSRSNYQTFSAAYAKLLLQIGSEVDVSLKMLCREINGTFSGDSIVAYQQCVCTKFVDFASTHVAVKNTGIHLTPWQIWQSNNSPLWWTAYNKIKHERTGTGAIGGQVKPFVEFANLDNTLNALAGLYQIMIFANENIAIAGDEDIQVPLPASRLFVLTDGRWKDVDFYGDIAMTIKNSSLILSMGDFTY